MTLWRGAQLSTETTLSFLSLFLYDEKSWGVEV
jgi:hypothetical protein